MRRLTLPLNGIYFDQIAAGTKREEYRLCTPFWKKRLALRSYDEIVLTRGYPKGGGIEGQTRLTRQWNGYVMRELTHPHFGPDPVHVFAIDVSLSPRPVGAQTKEDHDTLLPMRHTPCRCTSAVPHMLPGFANGIPVTQQRGCICPPTSEQTCMSKTCPRKDLSA